MSSETVHRPRNSIPDPYTSPPITIILTVILLVFFFIGFFCIYFCRCFMQNLLYTWHLRHSPTSTPLSAAGGGRNGGLHPSIIQSFPTFTYSSVKDYRKEKYGLECAICLVEFEDKDVLRFMTSCCHVFHEECIDLWLESHKTCPVCRRNLELPIKSPQKTLLDLNINDEMEDINENELLEDSISITIRDEEHEEERATSSDRSCEQAEVKNKLEKFSRSHSTGHSIRFNNDHHNEDQEEEDDDDEGEDKFTLRLPKHVKAKIMRGHQWSQSCTTFGEFKTKSTTGNGGFGEISDSSQRRNNINVA